MTKTHLDWLGVLGARGVKGFACGFNVNGFALGFSVDFSTKVAGGVDSLELPLELLLLLTGGGVACGVELGPCDLSECGVDDGVG